MTILPIEEGNESGTPNPTRVWTARLGRVLKFPVRMKYRYIIRLLSIFGFLAQSVLKIMSTHIAPHKSRVIGLKFLSTVLHIHLV